MHRKAKKDHESWDSIKTKTLPGHLRKAANELKGGKSWDWLKKGHLQKETESTFIVEQDQAVSINSMNKGVFGENASPLCRLWSMMK